MITMRKVINISFSVMTGKKYLVALITVVSCLFVLQLLVAPAVVAGGDSADGMKLVPAGKFKFGDEDEGTDEVVDLRAYYIDINETTNAEYKKQNPAHKFPSGKADHPVTNISWHSANTYCKKIGKRLPNEDEWEKAARGTDGRYYPWGEDYDETFLNSSEGGKGGTAAVGSYADGKSPYGINDMSGNVREWVDDWYSDRQMYRVIKGGGFLDGEEDVYTFSVRKSIPEDIKAYVGFRCAK